MDFTGALEELVERAAGTSVSVLIVGEMGTGKGHIARSIHDRSARRSGPFCTVNVAALPPYGSAASLLDVFRMARGGTLLLDEIGGAGPLVQRQLLSAVEKSCDATDAAAGYLNPRIVAATSRELATMVRRGLLREDLFYRSSGFTLRVPPLRERQDDIEPLVRHFVSQFNRRFSLERRIDAAALDLLRRHDWPGNVRELKYTVEAAMIVCDGPDLLASHFGRVMNGRAPQPQADDTSVARLRDVERLYIERALHATHGRRAQAARLLGISERNLYRKIHTYQLENTD